MSLSKCFFKRRITIQRLLHRWFAKSVSESDFSHVSPKQK